MTHAEFVLDLISGLEKPTDPGMAIALAQVHATMALVEAVENWQPQSPEPEPEPVPFEQTKAGWKW